MNIESINNTGAETGFSGKSVQTVNDTEQKSSTGVATSAEKDTANKDLAADMLVAKSEKNSKTNNEEDASSLKEMKDINKIINHNTIAEFGYNEPTKRITIKIKDKETNEVIKEIPSEKALKMLAKAWELAGIMVDEKR